MIDNLPEDIEPVHVGLAAKLVLLRAIRDGALDVETVEEAASRGSRLAAELLTLLELEEAAR
jgi:hypothetical protein